MATVRYFAAAAEAARTESEQVAADTLGQLLDGVRERHGARLSRILDASSILHEGRYVRDPGSPLPTDAVVDVLPPFAGG